jgi:hypothetical protein
MHPAEFLACLRTLHGHSQIMLVSREANWVRAEDVPGLIAQLASHEPCPHVATPASSYAAFEFPDRVDESFVGQEAVYMLEGFQAGRYPPTNHSHGHYAARRTVVEWLRDQGFK